MPNKHKTNNCIMCNGLVRDRKIIYNTGWVHCCIECHRVLISPTEYNFIEDADKARRCRKCKDYHPQTLRHFTFNPRTKKWATSCRRPGLSKLPKPTTDKSTNIEHQPSVEELLTKRDLKPKKRKRGHRVTLDYHSPLVNSLSQSETEWLKRAYSRIAKRNERKFKDYKLVTFKVLVEIYLRHNNKCYYTDLEMNHKHPDPLGMSVDRIDSSIGYTEDNIVFCCWFVNVAKNSWSIEQMRKLWKYLPCD